MNKLNWPPYVNDVSLDLFIDQALYEDVGSGDHSTLSCIPAEDENSAKLLVKEDCILAGVDLAEYIFTYYDDRMRFESVLKDGTRATVGDIAFYIHGNTQSILTTERLVLNSMQRMSGIASLTHHLTKKIEHTSAKLLDTRKTTPNFRLCEKWAVAIGGGYNHRYGLYDMVMLKDNHIDYCGSITKAVNQTKIYLREKNLKLKIEVEVRNLEEVVEALAAKVDRIMLDNMDIDSMRLAVEMIDKRCETEASGGITEETLVSVAETGVEYISMGALTHSAKNIDLSLKAVKK